MSAKSGTQVRKRNAIGAALTDRTDERAGRTSAKDGYDAASWQAWDRNHQLRSAPLRNSSERGRRNDMSNDHSNPHSQQHLHKKQHKNSHGNPLPHLKDAAHPDTGKVDQAALIAGSEAWKEAIQSGEYELVSATEIGIDENTDVLVLTRRKLK